MEKETEKKTLLFTRDKPAISLAIVSGVLAFANLVITLVRLRSNDFKVPVQYIVNDGSVLQRSSWFTLYSLALFSILSTAVIIFIAHKIHKGNRLFAIGILAVYVVVAIVAILVTNALLRLVSTV